MLQVAEFVVNTTAEMFVASASPAFPSVKETLIVPSVPADTVPNAAIDIVAPPDAAMLAAEAEILPPVGATAAYVAAAPSKFTWSKVTASTAAPGFVPTTCNSRRVNGALHVSVFATPASAMLNAVAATVRTWEVAANIVVCTACACCNGCTAMKPAAITIAATIP